MEKMVEVERATQEELRQDLKSLFQGAIRVTLEMVLEEELKAMVGARRFERVGSRKDHRNGTYLRRLLTSLGQIDVMVPRSREGGSPADVMGRYRRRSEEVDEMMVEAYVSGVSQRKMGDVTEALLGERVGRSTVSRVAKRLDGAVEALRSAPIEGPHPYLYLDATFLDARWARKVENVSALVAYAVDPDGHRRLLAITLGPEESEDSWSELLEQLLERGLSGVELVIADKHAGLAAAVRRFLPEVRRQRCTVHLQRNVLAKVPHRLRKRVAREVAAVFRAPGLAKAKKRLAEITARWHNELPEAMRVLERGFTAATQFYAFPEPHWARLRTTNSLERLHTEIKRRIRSAGAFPDRASALRLITAVALRTTAVWSERRYLDLSLLEPKEIALWRARIFCARVTSARSEAAASMRARSCRRRSPPARSTLPTTVGPSTRTAILAASVSRAIRAARNLSLSLASRAASTSAARDRSRSLIDWAAFSPCCSSTTSLARRSAR